MRFLHVNHRYVPFVGGSERYIQVISEALAARAHHVTVVTSDAHDLEYFWDARRKRIQALSRETVNGVVVRRVAVRHLPGSSIVFRGGRRALGELSRLPLPASPFEFVAIHQPWMPDFPRALSEVGPVDLIHATNLGLEGLAVRACSEAHRRDVPFVLTPFIHLGTATDRVSRRYVTMPHHRKLLRTADALLVMTEIEADFVASLGVSRQRIEITGAGIDLSDLAGGDSQRFRARHNLRGFVVASIGPPSYEKGTVDVVRAVIALRRAGVAVDLVLAGPPMSAFDRWFAMLPDDDRAGIHVLGFVDTQEKRDLLAAMDVLAVPSRSESFGIVYLEAWAYRKPVIAADAGAVVELVRHDENGLIVPFGDAAAIDAAIRQVMTDSAGAHRLGQSGYERTMQRYQWAAVVSRICRAYEHVTGIRGIGTSSDHKK